MNQAILVNDDMHWNDNKGCVEFSAIFSGSIITCEISSQYLTEKGCIESSDSVQALEFCETISFDIEEDAQEAINDERQTDDNILFL